MLTLPKQQHSFQLMNKCFWETVKLFGYSMMVAVKWRYWFILRSRRSMTLISSIWNTHRQVNILILFIFLLCLLMVLFSFSLVEKITAGKSVGWNTLVVKMCEGKWSNVQVGIWISNYISGFMWSVITHPCSNFNGSLSKLPLRLGHEWVLHHTSFYVSVIVFPWPNPHAGLAKFC